MRIRVFDRSEYLSRLGRVKLRMEAAGLEALCVVNPGNMYYLTGYLGESAYVPQAVIVSLSEEEPWIILRMQDTHSALPTVFMAEEKVEGYPESYIGAPDRNGFEYIAQRMQAWGLGKKRIGVEKADRFFTANAWEALQRSLPDARFEEATAVVSGARLVKSEAELALMKAAAAITDSAIRTAYEVIRPGVRECDAAAQIYGALIRGTKEYGGIWRMPPQCTCRAGPTPRRGI